ncbi:hypothetical protein AAT19DRAFT_11384 [Rhodotorula toruloides]|uniref:Uncharacterized protein n=1 Tax=Rhodotorula toruloides TaxID=5286 RepID=A0A2S9ZWM3_RHOTO|nr:hypothetical protein AAT19DRAFT_11384 [Rhodotorula toruloides]
MPSALLGCAITRRQTRYPGSARGAKTRARNQVSTRVTAKKEDEGEADGGKKTYLVPMKRGRRKDTPRQETQ